ncbi:MAG: outer membrane beta-barrel protein, partial [Candidatus Acidiferrales bacterium]
MIQSSFSVLLFSLGAGMICAQTAQWHGVDFSGLADGYYSYNHNDPSSGLNQFYTFDDKTDQWDLNLLKATVNKDPDPIGFRVDVGLGRAMEIMHTPSPDPSFFNYVEQAYVSLKPKHWKGFEADFGDFVTSAGAEVIETKDDWNYSRSLLFTLAIPFYHFGVRTSMPVGSGVTVGLQLVNGWNEIVDKHGNNMQTVGITAALARKMFTWSNTYYTGPQYTSATKGNRGLYDTTLLLTPWARFNAYVNFDYGRQHGLLSEVNHWEGIAVAARYQLGSHFAISPRVEYYDDATGFTTGAPQRLHEVT